MSKLLFRKLKVDKGSKSSLAGTVKRIEMEGVEAMREEDDVDWNLDFC
jgi:uncharacterized protein YjhX (UPF0386 family)